MAVKLRLTRMGRKKRPFYRIVALDSRQRRDGKYLENVGIYDPLSRPAKVEIDHDVAVKWLNNGAKPSDTVRSLFRREGIMLRWDMTKRGYDQEKIEAAVEELRARHYGTLGKEATKPVEKPVFDVTPPEPVEKPKPKKEAKKEEKEEKKEEKAPEKAEAKVEEKAEAKAEEKPAEEPKAEEAAEEEVKEEKAE